MKIRTIRHKGLKRLIEGNDPREIRRDLEGRVRRVITALILAENVESILAPPGWRIHELKGDRAGTWSISVSGNWRITFEMEESDITRLDLEDYH